MVSESGKFLQKWLLGIGAGYSFNHDWIEKKNYHKAAASLVDEEFRTDTQGMVTNPDVDEPGRLGFELNAAIYPWQSWVGVGPTISYAGLGSNLNMIDIMARLEADLHIPDWPYVSLIMHGGLGLLNIWGESKAAQTRSHEEEVSASWDFQWRTGGALQFNLLPIISKFSKSGKSGPADANNPWELKLLLPFVDYSRAYCKLSPERFGVNDGDLDYWRLGIALTIGQKATAAPKPPIEIRPPADKTVEATAVSTQVDIGRATATNLGPQGRAESNAPKAFPLGKTEVKWTATDPEDGRTASAVQNITVRDRTPPVIQAPPDVTVNATGELTSVNIGTATATDIFGPVTISNDAPTGGFKVGEHLVTWTAKDRNGNVAKATQKITVIDKTKPHITPPADITIEATGEETPVELGMATANEVRGQTPTITPDRSGPFKLGTHTVTWTATYPDGQTVRATQTVIVQDTTPPTIEPPPDITITATVEKTPVEIGMATATDLVDPNPSITSDAPKDGFSVGRTKVWWSAQDASGNIAKASRPQIIAVQAAPEALIPDKHPLDELRPITITAHIEFISGQLDAVQGELGTEAIKGLPAEIAAKIREVYPEGVPKDSTLALTITGHASSDYNAKGNMALSIGRAAKIKQQLFDALVGNKEEPFTSLNIQMENFSSFGAGEMKPVGTDGNLITPPFGGHENDRNEIKDNTEFVLCKDTGAKKDILHTKCRSTVVEDMPKSRRVEIEVQILPPGTSVARPSILDISTEQKEGDEAAAKTLQGILTRGRLIGIKGIKTLFFDKESHTFNIVIDETGFTANMAKIRDQLVIDTKAAFTKMKTELSSACTIKFWLFQNNPPPDYADQIRRTFYALQGQYAWPFAGGIDVGLVQEKYVKGKALTLISKEREAEQQVLTTLIAKPLTIGDYKAAVIPIKDMAKPTVVEETVIKRTAQDLSSEGKKLSLYINFSDSSSDTAAISVSNMVRHTYPALGRYFSTADVRLGNYVVIVSGADEVELDSDAGNAVRKVVFEKLMELKR